VTEIIDRGADAAGRRTQAERRDSSERELVTAAIEVVAAEGVSALTFEAIGRRAGKSRGLVTQRFGSKQGLVEAMIAHLHDRQENLLLQHGVDAMPGLQAVLTYVDSYLRGIGENDETRAYFRMLSSAVAEGSALRQAFAAEHVRVERRLEGLLLRGQAEGDIRREIDADAAALMIGSQLLGLSMQMLVDPDMDLEPIRETTLATLRLSFGVRPQPRGRP
jgi:AcrR family transcriptional regulator